MHPAFWFILAIAVIAVACASSASTKKAESRRKK
jgi:hypothetical protein